MVPSVDAVVIVTVMHVLLHVSMVRGRKGDDNAGVWAEEVCVVVSLGKGMSNVGGTRGKGIVSSAADVLGMSVVRGMRVVGGVREMFMCLARACVGGEV